MLSFPSCFLFAFMFSVVSLNWATTTAHVDIPPFLYLWRECLVDVGQNASQCVQRRLPRYYGLAHMLKQFGNSTFVFSSILEPLVKCSTDNQGTTEPECKKCLDNNSGGTTFKSDDINKTCRCEILQEHFTTRTIKNVAGILLILRLYCNISYITHLENFSGAVEFMQHKKWYERLPGMCNGNFPQTRNIGDDFCAER